MCVNIIEERGIAGDPQWFYFSPVPSNTNSRAQFPTKSKYRHSDISIQ